MNKSWVIAVKLFVEAVTTFESSGLCLFVLNDPSCLRALCRKSTLLNSTICRLLPKDPIFLENLWGSSEKSYDYWVRLLSGKTEDDISKSIDAVIRYNRWVTTTFFPTGTTYGVNFARKIVLYKLFSDFPRNDVSTQLAKFPLTSQVVEPYIVGNLDTWTSSTEFVFSVIELFLESMNRELKSHYMSEFSKSKILLCLVPRSNKYFKTENMKGMYISIARVLSITDVIKPLQLCTLIVHELTHSINTNSSLLQKHLHNDKTLGVCIEEDYKQSILENIPITKAPYSTSSIIEFHSDSIADYVVKNRKQVWIKGPFRLPNYCGFHEMKQRFNELLSNSRQNEHVPERRQSSRRVVFKYSGNKKSF